MLRSTTEENTHFERDEFDFQMRQHTFEEALLTIRSPVKDDD